jgi:CDP-paratose 2-epimerase
MNLLITGGCGFLGSNLAAEGLRRGDAVTVLDHLGRQGATENLAWLRSLGKVTFIHADIRDAPAVARAVAASRPEAIFHLAGQVAMTTSVNNPRLDFETNALGSLNVLEAVRAHAPQALVTYSSTNKVYGDLEQYPYVETATRWSVPACPAGFAESTPLDFHSPYGCSKGSADQYMQDYARMFGLHTVVFRHSSMYGGRQFASYDQGWIGWFCQQAVIQRKDPDAPPFTISGDGKQVRDVLHATDLVDLYFTTVQAPNRAQIVGQAFNIGGGMANSLSLLELFAALETILGVSLRFTRLPPRASDQRVFVADTAKAGRLLGWQPRIDVMSGLAAMLTWVDRRA